MKGHKHADLAIQYWTEAKDDAEAWWNWELMEEGGNEWGRLTTHPSFRPENQYRRKPKTKLINGFEVPDISFVPDDNEVYYCPVITPGLAIRTEFCFIYEHDVFRSKTGQCYPYTPEGKAAAIKHALAMLGFDSVEEMEATLGGNK